jgi:hypothetical protein
MFTKGLTIHDTNTDVQFVVNDIPEGLRIGVVISQRKEADKLPESRVFFITVTDADELEQIGDLVTEVDFRLHPERYELDDDEDEDDEDDDGDDDEDDDFDDEDEDDDEDDDDDDSEGVPLPEKPDDVQSRDTSEDWKRGTVYEGEGRRRRRREQ